jgi:2-oxoglutarate dehydrogenase complex dehydrogenase (E1) component-like enzyme
LVGQTEIPLELIRKIGERATAVPADFNVHPKIEKNVLEPRRQMAQGKLKVDWGCAEMFALGSLLLEGRRSASSDKTCSAARSVTATRACTTWSMGASTTRCGYGPATRRRCIW